MSYIGGNSDVKSDPIWIIAERNNKKVTKKTFRLNGVRVTEQEFKLAKKSKWRNWSEFFRPFYLLLSC